MRRLLIVLLALLILSLAACGEQTQDTPAPTQSAVVEPALDSSLAGTWTMSGEFAEETDYIETLTIDADGTICVQLDYRGEPYQTLTGTWYTEDRHLVVAITSVDEPYTMDYQYLVDGRTLTLQSDRGTYVYYSN